MIVFIFSIWKFNELRFVGLGLFDEAIVKQYLVFQSCLFLLINVVMFVLGEGILSINNLFVECFYTD